MANATKKTLRPRTARIAAGVFLLVGILLGVFDAPQHWNSLIEKAKNKSGVEALSYLHIENFLSRPFRMGLDIQGGTHLVYQANLSQVSGPEQSSSMDAVRDVIERRVNLYGVSEPVVQVERAGSDWRLVVELAGITDINAAIRLIGSTPYLEFKEELPSQLGDPIIQKVLHGQEGAAGIKAEALCASQNLSVFISFLQRFGQDPCFISSGLTGRYVKRAQVIFDQTTFQPQISLELTPEGTKLFADVTGRNLHKRLAIYLDGTPISTPVVQSEIKDGNASITGSFTPESAKELAGRLNAGALPVPIQLIAQQSVEASLGKESLERSLRAGFVGFIAVALFMVLWYRLPGIIAVAALLLYVAILLAVFKLIPVTLTVAGIAGFILSMGMAVDANILIFERLKEELRAGKPLEEAIREGFGRAWTSIRDSNASSLITSAILYWLGTSVVQGFALTLGIGIVVSMFSAISVTRTLLLALLVQRLRNAKTIFLSGVSK